MFEFLEICPATSCVIVTKSAPTITTNMATLIEQQVGHDVALLLKGTDFIAADKIIDTVNYKLLAFGNSYNYFAMHCKGSIS